MTSVIHSADFQPVTEALKRAALLARETAIATGTRLIIMQDGKITAISAEELAKQKQNKQK